MKQFLCISLIAVFFASCSKTNSNLHHNGNDSTEITGNNSNSTTVNKNDSLGIYQMTFTNIQGANYTLIDTIDFNNPFWVPNSNKYGNWAGVGVDSGWYSPTDWAVGIDFAYSTWHNDLGGIMAEYGDTLLYPNIPDSVPFGKSVCFWFGCCTILSDVEFCGGTAPCTVSPNYGYILSLDSTQFTMSVALPNQQQPIGSTEDNLDSFSYGDSNASDFNYTLTGNRHTGTIKIIANNNSYSLQVSWQNIK